MATRWTLSRAGIVNVYQYGDETLEFAGGRLLLRGVNGSGKSTAMNMLLPFLLDTDTRRIDAAGEQAGVLRSWMLSGRDEQQPVGYLWIELRHGDDHLTCGCGIRANRSTDRVTTWWFLTPRRPGLDLSLVVDRTPLSVDALRATLGPHAVFAHDQRQAYRAQVRDRLFGGADLDQHIRLLHVVRNPRVGDRIDLDLPGYLEDALPQLSEAALDDAAQPLEDLEEHRRNVEALTGTAGGLAALDTVYRAYARSELGRRADRLVELAGEHDRRAGDEERAEAARRAAEETRARARATVESLEADERRLAGEAQALESSEAYQRGAELNEVRGKVELLGRQVDATASRVGTLVERHGAARRTVEQAHSQAEQDLGRLAEGLTELATLAVAVGLPLRPPPVPAVETRPSPVDGVTVPTGAFAAGPVRAGLGQVRARLSDRRLDIGEVRTALDTVERAEVALGDAERAVHRAEGHATEALERFTEARAACDGAVEAWRTQLAGWIAELDAHHRAHGLAPVDGGLLVTDDLASARHAVAEALDGLVATTAEHHQGVVAELDARRRSEEGAAEALAERLRELEARVLPEPPALWWQDGDRRGPRLAELVDFAAGLDAGGRAGLEAALEAAGLLAAEIDPDGRLVLADGQLVAVPGAAAPEPLSALLTVEVPEELRATVPAGAVARVLEGISVRPADLDAPEDDANGGGGGAAAGGRAVVTSDGRFRMGALRGRHAKAEAEHVGLGARRAALDRQRAEARAQLDEARDLLALTQADLRLRRDLLAEVRALGNRRPRVQPVTDALTQAELCERVLDSAREQFDDDRGRRREAEGRHAEAIDTARRVAADHGLPTDRAGLDRVADDVREAERLCGDALHLADTVARSMTRWATDGAACDQACGDRREGEQGLAELRVQHETEQARLRTLEDAVGLDYEEVRRALDHCRGELRATERELRTARAAEVEAGTQAGRLAGAVASASDRRREAEAECVAAIPDLRDALVVPGLVASALHHPDPPIDGDVPSDGDAPADREPAFPVVAETPDGARRLARSVHAALGAGAAAAVPGTPTTGESVRQSLRQRRDALGAGWDAEDRQPDEALPLQVEVTGPLGRMPLHEASVRVAAQLRSMVGLLSAKQDQALRNLLQGLIAREVAEKLHAAKDLVALMNRRLDSVTTSQGIGVSLRWHRRDDLDEGLAGTIDLLAKPPDLRTVDEQRGLAAAVAERIAQARSDDPEATYRELIARVLDYRDWHRMRLMLHRPGRADERLTRRTALSEGEKKMVSYLPLFAAVAASCDALAEHEPGAPRFVLLDDAFAKVSEDNHAKLFGLLVEMDLDFVATSERLWGTHGTVPELAITEVLRDADLGVIVLEHSRWDGRARVPA